MIFALAACVRMAGVAAFNIVTQAIRVRRANAGIKHNTVVNGFPRSCAYTFLQLLHVSSHCILHSFVFIRFERSIGVQYGNGHLGAAHEPVRRMKMAPGVLFFCSSCSARFRTDCTGCNGAGVVSFARKTLVVRCCWGRRVVEAGVWCITRGASREGSSSVACVRTAGTPFGLAKSCC